MESFHDFIQADEWVSCLPHLPWSLAPNWRLWTPIPNWSRVPISNWSMGKHSGLECLLSALPVTKGESPGKSRNHLCQVPSPVNTMNWFLFRVSKQPSWSWIWPATRTTLTRCPITPALPGSWHLLDQSTGRVFLRSCSAHSPKWKTSREASCHAASYLCNRLSPVKSLGDFTSAHLLHDGAPCPSLHITRWVLASTPSVSRAEWSWLLSPHFTPSPLHFSLEHLSLDVPKVSLPHWVQN